MNKQVFVENGMRGVFARARAKKGIAENEEVMEANGGPNGETVGTRGEIIYVWRMSTL